jgi:hypothetical protein
MATYLVCEGNLNPAYTEIGHAVPGVFVCDTGWKSSQSVDFQDLVALLQFDPEICAYITGMFVIFLIMGHAAGHVARQLSRH